MPNCTSPADLSLAFNSVITIVLILEILSPSHLCFPYRRGFLSHFKSSDHESNISLSFHKLTPLHVSAHFKPFYQSPDQKPYLHF